MPLRGEDLKQYRILQNVYIFTNVCILKNKIIYTIYTNIKFWMRKDIINMVNRQIKDLEKICK